MVWNENSEKLDRSLVGWSFCELSWKVIDFYSEVISGEQTHDPHMAQTWQDKTGLRLAQQGGPTSRVSVLPFYLKTEEDPASETLSILLKYRRLTKSKKPLNRKRHDSRRHVLSHCHLWGDAHRLDTWMRHGIKQGSQTRGPPVHFMRPLHWSCSDFRMWPASVLNNLCYFFIVRLVCHGQEG
jgi:hypothetical protein